MQTYRGSQNPVEKLRGQVDEKPMYSTIIEINTFLVLTNIVSLR